jgi:hypothetical protein
MISSDGFVVSLQRNHAIRLPRLQVHQCFDDAAAVGTAIDVIAEKHEGRRTPIGIEPALRHQIAQFLQRAVNIADRINKRRCVDIGGVVGRRMMAGFRHGRSVRIHPEVRTLHPGSA